MHSESNQVVNSIHEVINLNICAPPVPARVRGSIFILSRHKIKLSVSQLNPPSVSPQNLETIVVIV